MCSNATVSFAQQFRLHNPSDASTIDKNVQEEATSFPKVAIRRHLENRMFRLNFEHESLFCLFLFDKAIRETRNRGAANRGKGYENRTLLPCLELAALSIFPFKADICSMGEREGNGATRVKRGGWKTEGKGKKRTFIDKEYRLSRRCWEERLPLLSAPRLYGDRVPVKLLRTNSGRVRQKIVDTHNYFRTQVNPPAANMLAMVSRLQLYRYTWNFIAYLVVHFLNHSYYVIILLLILSTY